MPDEIFQVNSSSFHVVEISSSLTSVEGAVIDFTQASIVTGSFSGGGDNLVRVSASYIIPEANTTASWAVTASYALNVPAQSESSSWASSSISSSHSDTSSFVTASNVIGTVTSASYALSSSYAPGGTTGTPEYAVSASWVSASVKITTADTASYVTSSNIVGTVTSASYALSASWSPDVESNNIASASFASSSISSSNANSASYIIPGATFMTVSGSNGVPPAYIEPYDYSADEVYRPPVKEGRTFWDHKWEDWKWYIADGLGMHLGREVCIAVHNPTATPLPRLSPVYLSG